ncbi:MAG: protein kinase [Actinomycetota bacterium]|nr:protein kinase [Actinomycetota bacterium]
MRGPDGETDDDQLFVGPPSAPDRYRLVRAVGVGGEGEVWAAEQRLTDSVAVPVAVKILSLIGPESAERSRRRWEDQVARVRLLRRPAIARAFESFAGPAPHRAGAGRDAHEAFYVVLEWVAGPNLEAWIHEQPDPTARLDAAVEVLLPVAQALDYMHSRQDTGELPVVHGDVKPANIVLGSQGGTLVDFGLVRWVDGTPPSAVGGTSGYLAPEVLEGGAYSPASDRFAFGGVLYFLVTGHHPPVTHDASRMRDELLASSFGVQHPGLVDHLLGALAVDPGKRPPAVTAWLSAFGAATSAPSPRGPATPRRGRRLRGAGAALVAVVVAAVLGVGLLASDNGSGGALRRSLPDAPAAGAQPPARDIVLEVENGIGDGNVMPRSGASNARTLWLHDGQKAVLSFTVNVASTYSLAITYSNDNDDALPSEEVLIEVDGARHASFVPDDTGSGGAGWNVFHVNRLGDVTLGAGTHELVVAVAGGDGYGVEIDRVRLSSA